MTPVKIVAGLLVFAGIGAVVQTLTAERPGKKLALASIRYALEERARTDRDGLLKDALSARARLKSSGDLDVIFRDVTTVWLAREPSSDLKRPTKAEMNSIPTGEALLAVRRLTPATGIEGARIRSLYESRRKAPREQQPVLARLLSTNPGDLSALRAYSAALRLGVPEERRKAIELGREYVQREEGSALSRLTLALALFQSSEQRPDPKLRSEAHELAVALQKEVPENSSAYEAVERLVLSSAPRRSAESR